MHYHLRKEDVSPLMEALLVALMELRDAEGRALPVRYNLTAQHLGAEQFLRATTCEALEKLIGRDEDADAIVTVDE